MCVPRDLCLIVIVTKMYVYLSEGGEGGPLSGPTLSRNHGGLVLGGGPLGGKSWPNQWAISVQERNQGELGGLGGGLPGLREARRRSTRKGASDDQDQEEAEGRGIPSGIPRDLC